MPLRNPYTKSDLTIYYFRSLSSRGETSRTVTPVDCYDKYEEEFKKLPEQKPVPVEKQACHDNEKRVCELPGVKASPLKQIKKYGQPPLFQLPEPARDATIAGLATNSNFGFLFVENHLFAWRVNQ